MKKTIAIFLALGVLAGCGGGTKPELTLPDAYDAAYKQVGDENWSAASSSFSDIEKNFPSTQWAADALVMAAYSAYMDNDFAGAILMADRFMRFHPGHRDAAYVMYLRGMSYYRQVSDVRREPGMSMYALNAFTALTQRFPQSPYAKNAENKIIILKNYIAGKMMYSARRDMRKQNWTNAVDTLQILLKSAPETDMTPEAMFRLSEAYTAIGLAEQADGFKKMLALNYPDSEWSKK